MKTAAEREAEFRADLKALLDKHGAEIEAEMRACTGALGYGKLLPVCTITIYDIYDHRELVSSGFEFNL